MERSSQDPIELLDEVLGQEADPIDAVAYFGLGSGSYSDTAGTYADEDLLGAAEVNDPAVIAEFLGQSEASPSQAERASPSLEGLLEVLDDDVIAEFNGGPLPEPSGSPLDDSIEALDDNALASLAEDVVAALQPIPTPAQRFRSWLEFEIDNDQFFKLIRVSF